MKTIYKYWKNSNTDDIIMSQEFTETEIDFQIEYYRPNPNTGSVLNISIPDMTGYVEITEKKYNRIKRKQRI